MAATKTNNSLLSTKIAQFIAEVGDRELTQEQGRILYAFTEAKKDVKFNITDCEGIDLKISIDPGHEVRKILIKHYNTKDGTVTAKDILKMFDIVRKGEKKFSNGNYVYSVIRKRNGVTYKTVIKIFSNGKDSVLKSFHSDIGYEKRRKIKSRPAANRK